MAHSNEHKIHASMLVDCPFSATIDMLQNVLEGREVLMVSPVFGVREQVRIGWATVDDLGDSVRGHDAIALYWKPQHEIFPSFAGTITVRPHERQSRMRISGNYTPPLGRTGAVFDRLAGRSIARATLQRLLHELAHAVESRYLVYLQQIGAAGADRHTGRKRNQVLRTH